MSFVFKKSLLITSTLSSNSFINFFDNSWSFSITTNFFGFFDISNFVKFPVPGPISIIISFLFTTALLEIKSNTFLSIKKFWPKLFLEDSLI